MSRSVDDYSTIACVQQIAVRNRTAQCNQIHGLLLLYGVVAPKGVGSLLRRLPEVLEDAENELSADARPLLRELGDELRRLDERVKQFDAHLMAMSQEMPACRRLMAFPGIGALTATALVAAVGVAAAFRSGRQMAAWLGLVPRQRSTGGRPTLLGISKRGGRYLRTLLIHDARSSIRFASRRTDRRAAAGRLPPRSGVGGTLRPWPSPTRTRGQHGPCWSAIRCSTSIIYEGRRKRRKTRRWECH